MRTHSSSAPRIACGTPFALTTTPLTLRPLTVARTPLRTDGAVRAREDGRAGFGAGVALGAADFGRGGGELVVLRGGEAGQAEDLEEDGREADTLRPATNGAF